MSRRYLFFTVFIGGMTTLAIEFTTSRLLQTVYGTSNLVWANVIGMVLLFLTAGYFFGGWLADRYPRADVFYGLVCAAAISAIFCLLLTSSLLRTAASALAALNIGALVSSFFGVVFALLLPITLLGTLSPFAIRLGVRDVSEAGRISGQIYAISTLGSLLGTYLPVLWIIPQAGSRATALIFGLILLFTGLGGLWSSNRRVALATLLLPMALAPFTFQAITAPIKQDPQQIFETESPYNYIQVWREADCNYLLLNEGQAYHSYYCDDGRVPSVSVWSAMLAAPFFNPVPPDGPSPLDERITKVAVIGLAAGTIPKQFVRVFGSETPIAVDGIELDPEIINVGYAYFELQDPQINVIVGDGRYELNRLSGNYDVITIDAYKVPYIPWHLTTAEFFEEVAKQLNPHGVVAINVGRVPEDRRLIDALTATMSQVFPSIHTVDVPGSLNTILFATMQPTSASNLDDQLEQLPLEADPLIRQVLVTVADARVPTQSGPVVFTDERAPLETLVDSLVIRYLFETGIEGLPTVNN